MRKLNLITSDDEFTLIIAKVETDLSNDEINQAYENFQELEPECDSEFGSYLTQKYGNRVSIIPDEFEDLVLGE